MPVEIPDTPHTRTEQYLAAANGQEVELPDPLTREEAYLYEIATKMQGGGGGGGGVTVEPLSVTANGTYTAPSGKAYSPVTVAVDTDEWQRPSDWPDIDALADLEDGDRDCLYLTYDLRKTPGYGWIGLYGKTADSTAWTLERGHVSNGAFVADETYTVNSNAKYRQTLDSADGDVQLWRVTSTGRLTDFGFVTKSTTVSENYDNVLQPCVDRAGILPWRINAPFSVGNYDSTYCNATRWMQHDAAAFGTKVEVTSIRGHWSNAFSLQSIDLSKWDTSLWAVTEMRDFCYKAYSLKNIDISNLDTSGWEIENASTALSYCSSLRTAKGFAKIPTSTNCSAINIINTTESLEFFDGFSFRANYNLTSAASLTPDSLVSILTALPETQTTLTLTIGQNNLLKLTAEQIAIATGKGWTVA